jgi:hypothetical protein
LKPVINLSPETMTLLIFTARVVQTGGKAYCVVVDISDKNNVPNISATLCKNMKWLQCDTQALAN